MNGTSQATSTRMVVRFCCSVFLQSLCIAAWFMLNIPLTRRRSHQLRGRACGACVGPALFGRSDQKYRQNETLAKSGQPTTSKILCCWCKP